MSRLPTIRTIREAELEMELADARRKISEMRWTLASAVETEPKTPMRLSYPLPQLLKVVASVDILRHAEGIPDGQIVITACAYGTEGKVSFRSYITESDLALMSTRDSAEYISRLHERACRQIAAFFKKKHDVPAAEG